MGGRNMEVAQAEEESYKAAGRRRRTRHASVSRAKRSDVALRASLVAAPSPLHSLPPFPA